MNRRALKTLLSSGRFLCFDARAIYLDLKDGLDDRQAPNGKLFDLSTLNLGIFFKEVILDEDAEDVKVSTRVYFPYNDDEVDAGGESALADPEHIVKVLSRRGAIRRDETLSTHDMTILDTLTSVPTFDPFLLLSQRREMEVERELATQYFQITEDDWNRIRRPVLQKIGVLVSKANTGAGLDIYEEYVRAEETSRSGEVGSGEVGSGEAGSSEDRRLMTSAVVDAIWRGEATRGSRSLIRSFRLDDNQTAQFLFAWKGINYYEFQYMRQQQLFYDFFEWLGSSKSLPRDLEAQAASAIDHFKYRRNKARALIRATHASVLRVVRNYNMAFDLLLHKDDPKPFRNFLQDASKNFLTVGLAIGVLSHTATAWVNTTAGKNHRLKSAELEPFYDFIIAINGQDFSSVNPG